MAHPKNIVVVNEYANVTGGAARVAINSAAELARRGFNVVFFSSIGPADQSLIDAGVDVIILDRPPYSRSQDSMRAALNGLWDKEAANAFETVLKPLNPSDTIVHGHTFRDALSASVPAKALALGFRTCYTAHEYSMGCPFTGFYDYRRQEACYRKGLSLSCICTKCNTGSIAAKGYRTLNQALYRYKGRLPKRFDHVFYVSEASRKILLPYMGRHVRSSVLPNPIEVDRLPRQAIQEGSPIVSIGLLNENKDPVSIAKAARMLNMPVTFVGSGPLEGEIKEANPDASITGWIPGAQVTEHLRRARCVVVASRWFETFALTVTEAAAAGIGAIVSDVCVASETVRKSGGGFIFKAGNVEDLASKLTSLEQVSEANRIGEIAYDVYWKDPLTLDRHIEALLSGYETAMECSSATS